MVSPARLPRTPRIQNTGEAQPGPPILQAMPEVQAAAVAVGDNFQIRNRCNSMEIYGAGIEYPASDRPLTFYDLLSTHNLLLYVSRECHDSYLHAVPNRPATPVK